MKSWLLIVSLLFESSLLFQGLFELQIRRARRLCRQQNHL